MPDVTLIIPEVESVNDKEFVITHWHVLSGSLVQVGDPLVDIETSKSSIEIASERSGILYFLLPAGSIVERSSAVGLISTDELTDTEVREALAAEPSRPGSPIDSPSPNGPVFSDRALRALQECAISPERFTAERFVTEEMVRVEAGRIHDPGTSRTRTQSRIDGSALVVVGGGGHAATLLDLVHVTRAFNVIGILDDRLCVGETVGGSTVLGPIHELATLLEQGCALAVNAVGGIGSRPLRQEIWHRIKDSGLGVPRLIHPSAVIDSSAKLGEGAQILAGSYVGARSQVGVNSIINSRSVVSHDCVIGDHSHIAPGAMLAGDVIIGNRTLIGMGATVHMQISIGDDVIVSNNSRIIENLINGA